MASPIGLGMLGLEKPPPAPKLATTFKVQPDLSVFAGAGLPYQKILPFFRYGIVKRIDQVYEFKLDRRRFTQVPSRPRPRRSSGRRSRNSSRCRVPSPSSWRQSRSAAAKSASSTAAPW